MSSPQLFSNRSRTLLDEIAKKEGFVNHEIIANKGFTQGENYSGDVLKVVISGDKGNDKTQSLHLIVKLSLKLSKASENDLNKAIYEREAFVYTKMLPALNELQKDLPESERFVFAKLYAAVIEDEEEIIVMEDLCKKGYRMLDRMTPFTYEQLVVCVETLARFHAASLVLKVKKRKLYEEIHATTNNDLSRKAYLNFISSNTPAIRKLIENEPYEQVIGEQLDNLVEIFASLFDNEITDPHSIFIHGDAWNNNFLFLDKDGKADKMVLIDWQVMRNASPLIDLSHILILGIDSRIRMKHYHEMLDLYYSILSSNVTKMGVDISNYFPPFVFRQHVQKYMKLALLLSFSSLPIIIATKDKTVSQSDLFEHLGDEEVPYKIPISEVCRKRFKELFEDSVKLNII